MSDWLDYFSARTLTARADAWVNKSTKLGVGTQTQFCAVNPLSFFTLSEMYAGEDLAAKIVDVVPREAMREGYEIAGLDTDEDDIRDYLEPYDLPRTLLDAWIWGRLFGGCLVWFGAADDDPSEPLADPPPRIDFLRVIDRRFAWASRWDEQGNVTHYDTTDPEGRALTYGTIHVSRLVVFRGARTEVLARRFLQGWDYSVLQRPYDALVAEGEAFGSARGLLKEASVGVFTVRGLAQKMTGGLKEAVLTQFRKLDAIKSTFNSLLLDGGPEGSSSPAETFTRVSSSFAGIPELTDRSLLRVAAAAEMPVTILTGASPAGFASGDSDIRWFQNRIIATRTDDLEPQLKRALTLLLRADMSPAADELAGGKRVQVRWPELWRPTAKERAEIYAQTATADATYIDKQVLLPEEVGLSRFGDDGYSQDTQIDRDLRETALEQSKDEMLNPPAPAPVPPALAPPAPPAPVPPAPAPPPESPPPRTPNG